VNNYYEKALARTENILTVLGEPKTWLVRLLRREFWPEIFNASLMMLYLTLYDLDIIYDAL
jgi:hypothetical protein